MSKLEPIPESCLLSVIVPSYNQGAFIRETVESCLAQDYRPIEVVVVDGGSKDDTVDILKSFGDQPELRWTSEPDRGVVDAVNKGFERARGTLCAIQSSDDYYLPGAFARVVKAFRAHPRAGLVFGNVQRVDAEGRNLASISQPVYSMERLLARELTIYQPAAFCRRDLAVSLGSWNPAWPYVPDTDLWLRLAFHADVVQCDEFLAACRTHPGQRDTHSATIYEQYLSMIAQSPELARAPQRLRRAAEAGMALLKFRYGGPWSDAELTRAAWSAVLRRPSLLASKALPKHRLVPGYFAMTDLRARLLRRLRKT